MGNEKAGETWRQLVEFVEPTDDDPIHRNPLNGTVMEKFAIEGVVIDRCPESGSIWLDRGELARLGSLSKSGRSLLKKVDRKPPKKDRHPPRGSLVSRMVCAPPKKSFLLVSRPPSGF